MSLDRTSLRRRFPALASRPSVVYLDSASTTQKPDSVVESVRRGLSEETANPGRGGYPWATRAAGVVESVRERVAAFVGAAHLDEIVFTSGATASLNAVALAWGLANLRDGDEILYNPHDHASTVLPWAHVRDLLERQGVRVRLVPYRSSVNGAADPADVLAKVTSRTRMITTSHVHNVYGAMTTFTELRERLPTEVLLCFDCSQSAGHTPVDVTALRADFAVLSAHKMFGMAGTGVLYAARRTHGLLTPFLPGGTTSAILTGERLEPGEMPGLLEGGSPHLTGITALGAALDFIDEIGLPAIAAHDLELTTRLVDRLLSVKGVRLLPSHGTPGDVRHGIVSFVVDGVSTADVGFVLSAQDIFVRTGNHCTVLDDQDTVRASTHVYNDISDIDRLADLVAMIAKEARA